MEHVFFEPWVGKDYQTGGLFSKKILVVGESHYCGSEDCNGKCGFRDFPEGGCEDFTHNTIMDYLSGECTDGWTRTFKKFERSLVNKVTSLEDSNRIWHSLAFFNYLQVAMTEARKAGTDEDYKESQIAFYEVIEKLQPELIIVWGMRLFYKLPEENWTEGDSLIIDGYDVKNGYYQLKNGRKARCIAVYHPSAGYSWNWWHKVISSPL